MLPKVALLLAKINGNSFTRSSPSGTFQHKVLKKKVTQVKLLSNQLDETEDNRRKLTYKIVFIKLLSIDQMQNLTKEKQVNIVINEFGGDYGLRFMYKTFKWTLVPSVSRDVLYSEVFHAGVQFELSIG